MNPSNWEAETVGWISEFKNNLVYRTSLRTARGYPKKLYLPSAGIEGVHHHAWHSGMVLNNEKAKTDHMKGHKR